MIQQWLASRTTLSGIAGIIVAFLIVAVPELAQYEDSLLPIVRTVTYGLIARFLVAGIVNEYNDGK